MNLKDLVARLESNHYHVQNAGKEVYLSITRPQSGLRGGWWPQDRDVGSIIVVVKKDGSSNVVRICADSREDEQELKKILPEGNVKYHPADL